MGFTSLLLLTLVATKNFTTKVSIEKRCENAWTENKLCKHLKRVEVCNGQIIFCKVLDTNLRRCQRAKDPNLKLLISLRQIFNEYQFFLFFYFPFFVHSRSYPKPLSLSVSKSIFFHGLIVIYKLVLECGNIRKIESLCTDRDGWIWKSS